ncbi:MAG: hypothetical protein EXR72_14645 [Myxococcales bacterium]|nr:hypothetical protein [Myxococcales bacterium]
MRLLSRNPAKRRNEWIVLAWTPIWMAAISTVMATRAFSRWGDLGHLALGLGLALPLWIAPFLSASPTEHGRPLLQRHAFRFAVWIALHTFLQTWFGTIFFFDHLGMEYHFPVTWTLHRTPLFLYFVTIAYFSTYYVALQIGERALRARFPAAPIVRIALRAVLCYSVAFGETFFMADESMAPYFLYRDRAFVLWVGSLCYGTVFLLSLPLIARLDEDDAPPPPLRGALAELLAANLIVFLCYDIYGSLFTPR